MNKKIVLIGIGLLLVSSLIAGNIPERSGPFRVTVGPPGNDFYEPPAYQRGDVPPPTEAMINAVLTVADGAKIRRWQLANKKLYAIRAVTRDEEFDFEVTTDSQIIELLYENEATKQAEEPDELILKGSRKEIPKSDFPAKALATITKINSSPVTDTWVCDTPVGRRYIAQAGNIVYYSTPGGQIRAIGQANRGALNEILPPGSGENPSLKEIRADAQKRLSPYQDKFSFAKNISRLGNQPKNPDGSFRFVVMGDSRSQAEMWRAIIQHIDRLDPKPAFVINTGDVVRRGYVDEYLDYYIPPLLKTDIPYFVALGNHDDGDSGLAIEFKMLFGENSLNYYFDFGNYRFILVDNSSAVLSPPETLAWLEQALKSTPKGNKIVAAFHQPPYDIDKWAYHSWEEKYSPALTDLLSAYRVEQVFLGHIHAYSTATHKGVEYTISGGGGAGLHDRFGPLGNVHHYLICDVLPDGTLKQQVVRFYKE